MSLQHTLARGLKKRIGQTNIAHSTLLAVLALLLLAPARLPAMPAAQNQKDQQNQKNNKDNNKNKAKNQKAQNDSNDLKDDPTVTGIGSLMPLPDAQSIELMISQMLAAWQIGDDQALHSFYAEDVLVVSGAWEPPLQGWSNYLRAYQSQRARTQGVRLERTNTFTKVIGDAAWCTYQWEFSGQVDGGPSSAVGQTTLLLEKRGGKWLIVVNHTSVSPTPQRVAPASAVPQSLQPATRPLSGGAPGA